MIAISLTKIHRGSHTAEVACINDLGRVRVYNNIYYHYKYIYYYSYYSYCYYCYCYYCCYCYYYFRVQG